MNNNYIELYISKNNEDVAKIDFLSKLYSYIIKSKNCKYVSFHLWKNDFEKWPSQILDKIFESYTYKYVNNYIDYTLVEGEHILTYTDIPIKDINDIEKSIESIDSNEIIVEGPVNCISYELIKEIQALNFSQMKLYSEENTDGFIMLGVYDYQCLIVISDVNCNDINEIKNMLTECFSYDEIKKIYLFTPSL